MWIEFYAFSYIGFIKKYLSSYTGSTYEQLLANSEFLYIENSTDTNRKIRKNRDHIHLWFQKWFQQQHNKHTWSQRPCEPYTKGDVHVLLGIWNQNSNTVIYEKCCSYLSISIFRKFYCFIFQKWLPSEKFHISYIMNLRKPSMAFIVYYCYNTIFRPYVY